MLHSEIAVISSDGSSRSQCSGVSLRENLPVSSSFSCYQSQNNSNDVAFHSRRIRFHSLSTILHRTLLYADGNLKLNRMRKSFFTVVSFCLIILANFIPPTTTSFFKNSSTDSLRFRRRAENFRRRGGTQCERITIPICMDIGYNLTDIALSPSNLLGQKETAVAVEDFKQIIEINCAKEMKQLVCAVFSPICMPKYPRFLPPCRYICERAKKGCGPILEKYQFQWPDLLKCEKFPFFSENPTCLHFNRSKEDDAIRASNSPSTTTPISKKSKTWTSKQIENSVLNSTASPQSDSNKDQCICYCHQPMITLTDRKDPLYNKVELGRTVNCVTPCKSPYFTPKQLSTVQSWITVLSILCFIVTSLTIGTFLIDASRFKYPERSIIFLSLCYMFVSMGYLIRIAAGHEAVACEWQSDGVQYPYTAASFLCGLVFFLLYFFGMAGTLWWVILSFSWLLASGLKWGSEAISSYSHRFHLVAWILPIIQTLTVFGLWFVDGDAVSGICYVGNQNTNNAYYFVVVPLLLYLGIGSTFSIFGFFDLCRIRTSIKKAKKKTSSFDKMFGRIGFFSLIYMVFTSILLWCYFYELLNRKNWANAKNCRKSNSAQTCSLDSGAAPDLSVFIVKYSMTLLIGTSNGIWICSKKTVHSWKQFCEGSIVYICGSGNFVNWFKRKKKTSVEIFRKKISTPQSSEQTSVELVPDSSLSGMEQKNEGSAMTLIATEDTSSRQDNTVYRLTSSSGSSLLTKELHSELVKGRSKPGKNRFKNTYSFMDNEMRGESRNNSLNCTIINEPIKTECHSHCSPKTSAVSASALRKSVVEGEEHFYLHCPSKYMNKCSKQCVVYCSHPAAMANLFERASPTSVTADGDGKVRHIHYHHHHIHHISPKTDAQLRPVQRSSCQRKCKKLSQSSSSSGCNHRLQSFKTEQNSYLYSNSLQKS